MAICIKIQLLSLCNGTLVYFVTIWYILSRFGMMQQEKSGNPANQHPRQEGQSLISFSI
jgi:hypothetical protein